MTTPATIVDLNLPTAVLIGRVNVGKSTLFNKLIEKNKALVSDIPGTTRTKNIGIVNWRGKNIRLIDTGGLNMSEEEDFDKDILKQTEDALKEADVIIFTVDIREGVLPQEKEIAKKIIRQKDKVIFVANKADSPKWETAAEETEWLKLGLGKPMGVSADSGLNLGDLLDEIFKRCQKLSVRPKKAKEIKPIRVSLIGRPNVGKSTLFNAIIGREEVIASDIAHTTRESYDLLTEYEKQPILFVDTAGIRRKAKVIGDLEEGGVKKSIQTVKNSDIILLILDAGEPISQQDKQLGGLLKENTKSVIIIVNKWDKAEGNEESFQKEVKERIYDSFPHLKFAPIVLLSAKTKHNVNKVFPQIMKAWQGRNTLVENDELENFLKEITRKHRPARGKFSAFPKIIGFKQVHAAPPIFEMTVKMKTSIHSSYLNYIKNKLREKYDFYATPIVIRIHKRKK